MDTDSGEGIPLSVGCQQMRERLDGRLWIAGEVAQARKEPLPFGVLGIVRGPIRQDVNALIKGEPLGSLVVMADDEPGFFGQAKEVKGVVL